jgi:hypothetical protein
LVLVDKLDGLQAAATLVGFVGATAFLPELPAGSRARPLRIFLKRYANESAILELTDNRVLRRCVMNVERVCLTLVEVSNRNLVSCLDHGGRRVEGHSVTEVLAGWVLRESNERSVVKVSREHGIAVRLVGHLDVKVHVTTAHGRVSSLTVELVKDRGLMLEVLGWESRLVVHLEGVSSERVHVVMMMLKVLLLLMLLLLLLLHRMCKRMHVRQLRSMKGRRIGGGHGQRSVQAQAKSWSMKVTCLWVVEGICATRSGGVVSWHLVRKRVEGRVVGI